MTWHPGGRKWTEPNGKGRRTKPDKRNWIVGKESVICKFKNNNNNN